MELLRASQPAQRLITPRTLRGGALCILVAALALPGAATGKSKGSHASQRGGPAQSAKARPQASAKGNSGKARGRWANGHTSKGSRSTGRPRKPVASRQSSTTVQRHTTSSGSRRAGPRRTAAPTRASVRTTTGSSGSGSTPSRSSRSGSSGSSGGAGNRRRGGGGKGGGGGNGGRGSGGNANGSGNPGTPPAALSPTAPTAFTAPGSGGPTTSVAGAPRALRAGAFDGVGPVGAIASLVAARASGSSAPASASDPSGASDGPAGLRSEPSSPSPIIRTVKQVVEVIPPAVWLLVGALALLTLLGGGASWLLAARKRRVERQREALLEDVGLLQRALLPPAPDQIAGVATSVAYRPARGDGAGGDFYDVFSLDDERLGLVIGELSSGGRPALGLTALLRHTLRAYVEAGMAPRTALQVASGALEHQLAGETATAAVAVYDRDSGTLTWSSAGHPPPIVLGAAAFEPVNACGSPPLCSAKTTGLRQTSLALPPGSTVCFYTDGLTCARVDGQPIGYRRLSRLVSTMGARVDATALIDRVGDEADARSDDMAACVLRVAHHVAATPAPGGVRRLEELEVSRQDLEGSRPAEFLTACGVPSDRVDDLVEEFRDAGSRLGGGVLRVRVGTGVATADLSLAGVDLLTPARA